jgi:hypothetical protein
MYHVFWLPNRSLLAEAIVASKGQAARLLDSLEVVAPRKEGPSRPRGSFPRHGPQPSCPTATQPATNVSCLRSGAGSVASVFSAAP